MDAAAASLPTAELLELVILPQPAEARVAWVAEQSGSEGVAGLVAAVGQPQPLHQLSHRLHVVRRLFHGLT